MKVNFKFKRSALFKPIQNRSSVQIGASLRQAEERFNSGFNHSVREIVAQQQQEILTVDSHLETFELLHDSFKAVFMDLALHQLDRHNKSAYQVLSEQTGLSKDHAIPSNQAVAKIWLNDPYGDEPLPETSEEDTSEDPFIYTHKTSSKKLSLKDSIVTLQDTAYHYYRIQFVRCLKGQLKEIADKHFNVNPNMEMSERFKRGGRPGVQELFEKLKNKLQPQSLIAKMAYTVADLERPVGSSLTAFVQLFCAQRNHYNQLRRSNLFPAMEWTRFLITFISKYKRNGNDSEYSQLQNKNQETHPDRKLHEMGFKDFKDLIFH